MGVCVHPYTYDISTIKWNKTVKIYDKVSNAWFLSELILIYIYIYIYIYIERERERETKPVNTSTESGRFHTFFLILLHENCYGIELRANIIDLVGGDDTPAPAWYRSV